MKFNVLFFIFALQCLSLITIAQKAMLIDSIPMRDGKKLACDIFIPDTSGGQQYPVILVQTPYNRIYYRYSLPLGQSPITTSHYAIVTVDWRGFYGSWAAWVAQANQGKDGYDCVEWIAQQSWSNGKIGTWGASALGKVQFQTAKENPPHLTCMVPLVAGSQYEYEEYYQGGVYKTEYVQQLDSLGFGIGPTIRAHPVVDLFWNYADTSMMYPEKIKVPALMIGGWYDHNIRVMFELFDSLRLYSPISVRDKHRLLFGPWAHGGFGPTQVGTGQQGQLFYPQAAGWSDSIALRFLDYHLRNIANGWDTTQYIKYFQMGENTWKNTSAWPPANASMYKLYFSGNTLTTQMPQSTSDSTIIVYDPRDPSPTIGGATLDDDLEQGPYDQVPVVESRNDIAVFSSVALGANVVLKGKPTVHLFVTSNRKDTDFSIRLTDVYPDGRSMLLSEGIKRLRFRNGFKASDTSDIVPGTIYPITIDLTELANTFLAGHKIRVDVASSNYTQFDCNLNNGGAMYTAGDTLVATNTVFTNSVNASYIELPLVDFTGSVNEDKAENNNFVAYPNPACDKLFITCPAASKDNISLKVSNITGKIIKQIPLTFSENNISTIDIHDLMNGIYFLNIYNSSKEFVGTKKIIVIK
jgi:hypothetical protein